LRRPQFSVFFKRTAEAIDHRRDLRVQFGQGLLSGFRRSDIDEFVLTDGAHVPPYGHQAAAFWQRQGATYSASSGRLKTFIAFANPSLHPTLDGIGGPGNRSFNPGNFIWLEPANTWSPVRAVHHRGPLRCAAARSPSQARRQSIAAVVPALAAVARAFSPAQREIDVVADDQTSDNSIL
jgi:hypothetical protein